MQYSSTIYKFKNIKNKFYDIIYTIKNYFIIIFLIFNFNNNKYNLNGLTCYGNLMNFLLCKRKKPKCELVTSFQHRTYMTTISKDSNSE